MTRPTDEQLIALARERGGYYDGFDDEFRFDTLAFYSLLQAVHDTAIERAANIAYELGDSMAIRAGGHIELLKGTLPEMEG